MEALVCPECGNATFNATLTTRTEYTFNVYPEGDLVELSEHVVDGGDPGDADSFACTDCGETFDALDAGSLATREQYDAGSAPCLYCGQDCNENCDEAQAGGFD